MNTKTITMPLAEYEQMLRKVTEFEKETARATIARYEERQRIESERIEAEHKAGAAKIRAVLDAHTSREATKEADAEKKLRHQKIELEKPARISSEEPARDKSDAGTSARIADRATVIETTRVYLNLIEAQIAAAITGCVIITRFSSHAGDVFEVTSYDPRKTVTVDIVLDLVRAAGVVK